MNPLAQAVSRIIKEQQAIIGPMALSQAQKVPGIQAATADDVQITGNAKEVLENLVNQYAKLFGKASVEVCKEAIEPLSDKISPNDLPDILKI
jgi:hypothetical protein